MEKLYEDIEQMCYTLSDELAKANMKVEKAGGELSAGDLEYIDKLTHALKSVKTTKAMLESEMEEGNSSYDNNRGGNSRDGRSYRNGNSSRRGGNSSYDMMGGSYARGRGRYSRRDSMGRYSDGSSYANEDMVSELRELMEVAPNEKTRLEFERFIQKIEQM